MIMDTLCGLFDTNIGVFQVTQYNIQVEGTNPNGSIFDFQWLPLFMVMAVVHQLGSSVFSCQSYKLLRIRRAISFHYQNQGYVGWWKSIDIGPSHEPH